jgi:hypothetical protein
MTGKQRIAAAMRHEAVDRVPVMCQLTIGHYLLNTGIAQWPTRASTALTRTSTR